MHIRPLITRYNKNLNKRVRKVQTTLKKHLKIKRNKRRLAYITLGLTILFLFSGLLTISSQKQELQATLTARQQKLIKLQASLKVTEQQKAQTEQEVKQKDQQIQQTQSQINQLNQQLQAKAAARQSLLAQAAAIVQPATAYAAPAPSGGVVAGCGDNSYANFIYEHESGCNTGATNPSGCYGIGQDCNGVVRSQCGADYACQNQYFTNYANKYGGWAGAYSFWQSHGWW